MREFSTLFASFKSPRSSHSAVLCRSFLRRLLCTKILIFHTQTQTGVRTYNCLYISNGRYIIIICSYFHFMHRPRFFVYLYYIIKILKLRTFFFFVCDLFPFFLIKKWCKNVKLNWKSFTILLFFGIIVLVNEKVRLEKYDVYWWKSRIL